jgi:hypothetical protein
LSFLKHELVMNVTKNKTKIFVVFFILFCAKLFWVMCPKFTLCKLSYPNTLNYDFYYISLLF